MDEDELLLELDDELDEELLEPDDELDEELDDELDEDELLVVVLAREHQVDVLEACGLVGKFDARQATPPVWVR